MAEIATSARKGVIEISPGRRDDTNKENDVPVLSLIQFSKAPFVTFGSVKVGTSRSVILRIENPGEDVEAEVRVEKIPSSKGFSVDHISFTIQPESWFGLTITWTPAEEGGVRELLVFNANGVLKHQAVMLGRAEAPKKKKKSLWDSIKNKKEGAKVGAPRGKKTELPLKMAANKTFQVSREPRYKRDKPRSPLASLNEVVRRRSITKLDVHSHKSQELKASLPKLAPQSLSPCDQDNLHHVQRSTLVVVAVPNAKLTDVSATPENKNLTKILNKTLSPIGTPERLKKLMPCIQTESPALATIRSDSEESTQSPVPSLKDALALIDSDLSFIGTSPRDGSSSGVLSDSLECGSGARAPVLQALPLSPEAPDESSEPRLTFFVNKKVEPEETAISDLTKKPSFDPATVIKGKAPVEENVPSARKIKKSRRRLLEKTLELSDSSALCDSGRSSPRLPVIDQETGSRGSSRLSDGALQVSVFTSSSPTPVTSPLPTRFSFLVSSPPPLPSASIPEFAVTSPPPTGSTPSPQRHKLSSTPNVLEQNPAPFVPEEDLFPIQMAMKSKKRKSEEYLRSEAKLEEAPKADRVKRSKMVAARTESLRAIRERGAAQRQQRRPAGSVRSTTASSLKGRSSVPAQPGSKLSSRVAPSLKSAPPVKKVVAVAQSKLTFIKPIQTAIPRHPMPFAAKNMFFDERWLEKQERGFTWWINYVLTPDDFKVNTEVAKVNAVSLAMGHDDRYSVPNAPTKEEMSFSTYTARRKLNRLRRSACQLFTSEAMVKAIQRLEVEVEARRLLVRKDRHLWKDIGERRKVLNWLLSYNPLWLRIGLETIFGELISLESNSDALGLAMFILQRLLWNPDIAAEFRHAKVPHLYKDGHEEALSRFTLKKLLLLVCFLDKAKESRLIEHNPCLFCVDAEFKTSKDLLLAFSRDFLSGEGILPRHLGYLGLPVSHAQKPLDEFNFAVKNLAVDLKCGIRLVRVMELLIQDWSLSAKLRLPAISRLQKIHNVDMALQVLKNKGVDLKDEQGSVIDSRDVVDGHREKTLNLLWKIIFAFHVEVILDEDQLKDEIGFLRRTLRTKRRLLSLRADRGPKPSPAKKSDAPAFQHSSAKISLLMAWARAVCDFYGLKVENFTVTFSDGRVLCYLIHHYHPGLLRGEAVSHSTTQTVECSPRGRLELSCAASDSDSSFEAMPTGLNDSPSVEFKELLENEKNNFRLVNTAVAFLGGVPAMINPADMSNTIPNEKVVISYLTFLCTRLLDLRNETRAARVIQAAWRNYRLKKDMELFKERNMAAVKIQLLVRRFLQRRRVARQNRAAVLIQALWRGHAARHRLRLQREAELRALRCRAATVIQAQWRMFSTTRTFHRLRYHAIVIQAQWRMRRAAAAYSRIRWAVTILQKRCRAAATARRDRRSYLALRAATVTIQRGFRRWGARKAERENQAAKVIQGAFRKWLEERTSKRAAAAVRIQSWYRMRRCLRRYIRIRRSTVLIQALCRGYAQRRCFRALKARNGAAIVIQSAFRGHAVRKEVARRRCAAVAIQRRFRATLKRNLERQAFVRIRCAAVAVQAAYRGNVTRQFLRKRQRSATAIQAAFRRYATQRRYLALRDAVVLIQRKYRATVLARGTRKDFLGLKNAAVVLQSTWRGRADRNRMESLHRCAALIQAHYRGHKARAEYRATKASAILLQRHYRAYVVGREARESYLCARAACVTLQAAFRGRRVRTELQGRHRAATVIQASVRMFLTRRRFVLLQSAAVIIQCGYRALRSGRAQQSRYRKLKQAAIKIQAVYRGFRVREELRRRHRAATVIQAQFRMYSTRMAFLATKCAAYILQDRYRAKRLRDRELLRYRSMKGAAVLIQAAYRGHAVRREVAEMHRATAVIQRKFLTVRERRRFLAMKAAALVCQRRFRAAARARTERREFLSKRQSAIHLQAAFRGNLVRRQLRVQSAAAVTIQSVFRMHRERLRYTRLQRAATVLQRRHRANREMRREVQTLRHKRNAAVLLQAAFRGARCRRVLRQKNQAAAVIQRAYRATGQRRKYLALKSSVLAIQRRYRANVAAKRQMQKYQRMRRASVILQAACRGQQVRREVARWHQAATVIQSVYRKHREEVKFQAMRLSAIIIQRRYRSVLLQREDRENFLLLRRSTVVLQAAFRGQRVRHKMADMHRAATVIQANYRMHKQQSAYRRQQWAACVLQRRYRATIVAKEQIHKYQSMRRAAVILQAACRGQQVRREVARWHQAATVIQSVYRKHREEVKFQAMRLSAIIIQRYYRGHLLQKQVRESFLQLRRSVVVLQAAFKGQCVRRNIAHMHRAATVIQANYRMHKQQLAYRRQQWAACVLQQRFRAAVAAKQQMQNYQNMRRAAVILQAVCRGQQVRHKVTRWHQAATVIQSVYRKHREEVKFQAMRLSAIIIQRRYRSVLLQRKDRENFLQLRRSAVVLQAAFRSYNVRCYVAKMHRAATVIQANYRMHKQQSAYRRQQWAASVLQQRFRAQRQKNLDVKRYQEVRKAAAVLQAAYRGMKSRRDVKERHQAAVVIQRAYRAQCEHRNYIALKSSILIVQRRYRATVAAKQQMQNYKNMRKAAVILQAAFRGQQVRREVARWHQAATVIQSVYRRHREEVKFQAMKLSAIIIQRRYRSLLLQRKDRENFLQLRRSAVVLQAAFRGQRMRRTVAEMHKAATVIQANYRKHREEVKLQAVRLAAIIIQRRYRSVLLQRKVREHFLEMKRSAIVLQAAFRGRRVRRDVALRTRAAVTVQASWRGLVQRRQLQRKRAAALALQRRVRLLQRGKAARDEFVRTRQAAVTLQRRYRAWIAGRREAEVAEAERRRRFTAAAFHHLCALKIQRALRAHWALEAARRHIQSVVTVQCWVRARQQRRRYLDERRKVVLAQRAVRSWLARRHKAASLIQRAVRDFLLRRRQRRVQQGIVKFQALWRGHRSRRLNDNPKLAKLRLRLRQVSVSVRDEDRLCNKTASALDYLLRYKQFSCILEALKNLETATRLSPECCERLVESGATTVIVTLIRCCNRSVPCMDVITFSVQILLNLSKYHKTTEAVYSVESSVDTLLDLLQRYREKAGDKVAEKGGGIFTKACFLLALLLQDRRRAQEVMKLPKVLERIRSIYRLTARKHKMDAERSVTKHKMNASINGSFYVPATPRKSKSPPRFAPDWVLRRDKLKDVVDPLRAIQMVADTLGVVL